MIKIKGQEQENDFGNDSTSTGETLNVFNRPIKNVKQVHLIFCKIGFGGTLQQTKN